MIEILDNHSERLLLLGVGTDMFVVNWNSFGLFIRHKTF